TPVWLCHSGSFCDSGGDSEVEDLPDRGRELLLRGDLRAAAGGVLAQQAVDLAAVVAVEDGQFLGDHPGHEVVEGEVGLLGGDEAAFTQVALLVVIVRTGICLLLSEQHATSVDTRV